MEDQKDKEALVEENVETRRQMLRKIGLVLAGTAAASIPVEVLGQVMPGQGRSGAGLQATRSVQLNNVKTAFSPTQTGEYNVFVAIAKNGAASAVVVPKNDRETTRLVRGQLGAAPATATLVGGMIQVNLGQAAAGRCSGNSNGAAVATFNPGSPVEAPVRIGSRSMERQ